MTYIQDIPEGEHRERLRREILGIIEGRREESINAFSELCKFSGIVYSGGAIAILSFIASRKDGTIPVLAILSFLFFVLSLLSYSIYLYRHYQLHNARWTYYANIADRFFTRQSTLEEVRGANTELQSSRLFRLLFWVPFTLAALGFACGAAAAFFRAESHPLRQAGSVAG
jgi:hypothetical protein